MKSNKTLSRQLREAQLYEKLTVKGVKKTQLIIFQTNRVINNKVIRNSSHCAECWSEKSRFMKQKHKK